MSADLDPNTPGGLNRDVSAGTRHSEPDGSATKPAISSSQDGASQGAAPIPSEPLTIFMCGPSKCEHDYSSYQDIVIDGQVRGSTLVCSKCGRTAFSEDAWL